MGGKREGKKWRDIIKEKVEKKESVKEAKEGSGWKKKKTKGKEKGKRVNWKKVKEIKMGGFILMKEKREED